MQLKGLTYNAYIFPLMFMLLWQNGSCKSAKTETVNTEQTSVQSGPWGGQNIRVNVTGDGAEFEFGCAHGSVSRSLTLNREGRFSISGIYVAETPGPARKGQPPKNQPAVYSGTVTDKSMALVVTLTESKEEIGTFELKHGAIGRVRKCL